VEPDQTFTPDPAAFIDFRDREACVRVREISRAEITNPPSGMLKVRVIDDAREFYTAFADDLVQRIREARDERRRFVAIVPVGPMPQYEIAARRINLEQLDCSHVHLFNMDEYADQDGNSAPVSWPGSFQRAMWERFLLRIDERVRPPEENCHFPTTAELSSYSARIEDLGGADVCYGGIGWCGHVAFWESHLGWEFDGDLDAYRQAGPRLVELHPMTIMQNALHSFSGDWSWVPPQAITIGPANILAARTRSFWLDGYLGGDVSWQRFIARLVLHGPVSEFVPGSLLQTAVSEVTLLGGVADDVEIHMA
jgi:glucosamine-6-phosphate deaminase